MKFLDEEKFAQLPYETQIAYLENELKKLGYLKGEIGQLEEEIEELIPYKNFYELLKGLFKRGGENENDRNNSNSGN